ncbi:MAG: PilZ domain-containing protein [Desulfotalea sp.]
MANSAATLLNLINMELRTFFPHASYTNTEVKDALRKGDIIYDQKEMVKYLLSAFVDEKIMEIELDNSRVKYYARLNDDPEGSKEVESQTDPSDNEKIFNFGPNPDKPGSYLHKFTHILSLPVEPSMGNPTLRKSGTVIIRLFNSDYTIEFGTKYENIVYIDEVPMLRLSFPSIARILPDDREFRVSVADSIPISCVVNESVKWPPMQARIHDISTGGMAIIISKKIFKNFSLNDKVNGKLFWDNEYIIDVCGDVRHITKIRKNSTIEYICGVEFVIASAIERAEISSLAAKVQRAHLREIAKLSNKYGINFII